MNETVIFSGKQKAIIGAICDQFKKNRAKEYFQYDPIDAQRYLIETGACEEYEIHEPEQFAILEELATLDLGIEINILENHLSLDGNCISDDLHNGMCLTEASDDEERERFLILENYGSVYIHATIKAIKRLKALIKNYSAKFIMPSDSEYAIEVYKDGKLCKTYHFPRLHTNSRPQLIISYAYNHKNESQNTQLLNIMLKRMGANTFIGTNEYVTSVVYGRTESLKVILPFFFDVQTQSIEFLRDTNDNLTQLDVDAIEDCYKKSQS